MRTRTAIRSLASVIFIVCALLTPTLSAIVNYFETELILKSKQEIAEAKLSGSVEEMEDTARASYEALIALRDGFKHLLRDLSWLFALLAVLSAAIFWIARQVPK